MKSNLKEKLHYVFLSGWRPYLWIAFFVFFINFGNLFADIVYLDDNVLVTGAYETNSKLSSISQAFKEDIFQTPGNRGTFYRPLLRISFIFDAQFGEKVVVFMSHLTNILLHILALCFLWQFLLKFKIKKEVAFFFVLFFGLHPLTAQTVSFIAGRNDSLLAIFAFPSLIFFLNFLETKQYRYYFWHFLFFALSLFTKETAIVIPPIIFLYILIFEGYKNILSNRKIYLVFLLGWFLIGIIWFGARLSAMQEFIGNADYNIFTSIFNNLPVLVPTIGKIFLPFDLSVFPVLTDMSFTYGYIAIFALLLWFIFGEKKDFKLLVFGFLWFLIFFLPTLIKPNGTMPEFSENRVYIPMFGFIFILLGLGKIKFLSFLQEKIVIPFLTIVLIIFSILTFVRNKHYENGLSFWKNAVETSPSFAFNHNNYGAMHYLNGNLTEAEKSFRQALSVNPTEPMTHNNLGLIFMKQERFNEAENEYKKEIEINPYYDNAHFNLGLLYYRQKKREEALESIKRALEINPDHQDALNAYIAINKEETI